MQTLMRRWKKKPYVLLLLLIGSATAAGIALSMSHGREGSSSISTSRKTTKTVTKADQVEQIHFAAMGDMLAHDTIIDNATTQDGYDFGGYFQKIRPLYEDADVVFCNQEGLSSGPAYGISGYPSFNAPTEFASALKDAAGCNLINLANNHMGDKGVDATNATINLWQQLHPLAFSGANKNTDDQQQVKIADVKGIKVGFVSFADFSNNTATPTYSVNIYHDEALVRKLVSETRKRADLVIVSMHWGTEDSPVVNTDQQAEVRLLASLGVDVIIGTGPHVLQKVETVNRPDGKQMTVWYSLGNMLSSQLTSPELFSGVARFDVVKSADDTVKVENLAFQPTYMHYEWTAAQKANNDLMARHNVMIYPLAEAADPLSRSQLGTTVEEQRQYIIDTLGPEVTVK